MTSISGWERLGLRTMASPAKNPREYLEAQPPERKAALSAVRDVILGHLPRGYEEQMQYGMISYVVPHRLYPAGYHCDPRQPLTYASLGAQKSHMALHLMFAYGDGETRAWLEKAWAAAGKKLDMGKACLRFKSLEDVPLEVIGQLIARVPVDKYLARVSGMLAERNSSKAAAKPRGKARAKPEVKTKSAPRKNGKNKQAR